MNDNNINNTYRATKNLNTALESPEYNVNDTLGINIKDVDNKVRSEDYKVQDSNNYLSNNTDNSMLNTDQNDYDKNVNNDFINNDISLNTNSNSFINDTNIFNSNSFIDNNNSVSLMTSNNEKVSTYTPTSPERKKKVAFSISTELKMLAFIVLILLFFVFLMPKFYRVIMRLKLFFFNR